MPSVQEPLAAKLAQDILRVILEFIEDDRGTLKACGRVNKAWSHASRALLFHSVDLSSILARNDWLSFFIKVPFGAGDLVRQITVRNAQRGTEFTSSGVRVLTHFAGSVTSLILSDVRVTDLANLASIISKFKHLRSLFLKRVSWDSNAIDYSQPLPPHQTLPPFVSKLRLLDVNLGHALGWLLCHPQTPIPISLSLGPIDYQWRVNIAAYLQQVLPALSDLSFSFVETTMDPFAPCCVSDNSSSSLQEPLQPFSKPTPIPTDGPLKRISDRFQERHGFSLKPMMLDLNGPRLRFVRLHRFFPYLDVGRGELARTVWVERILLIPRTFRGRIVIDVDVPTAGMVDGIGVDWVFLEDILVVYKEVEEVVFLATTDINLVGLDNLLSLRLPKAYGRGVLRVERGEDICG